MSWTDLRVESLEQLGQVLEMFSRNYGMVYRGQPCAEWKLTPSICRLFPKKYTPVQSLLLEGAAIAGFRRHARAYLDPRMLKSLESVMETLVVMQHYGAPTRLLDWTWSPWVAAYFAAISYPENDGMIWCFDRDLHSRIHLGQERGHQKDEAGIAQLDRMSKAETAIQWGMACRDHVETISTLLNTVADSRVSAQQSIFTCAGTLSKNHDELLESVLPSGPTYKISIAKAYKPELVRDLWRMNITPMALFPGMDGVGGHVRQSVEYQLAATDGGIAWVLRELDAYADPEWDRQIADDNPSSSTEDSSA